MPDSNIHRQNYTGIGPAKRVAQAINSQARQLNNVRGGAGLNVHPSRLGIEFTPTMAGSGFPWSQLCLGFSITGTAVKIIAGEVQWGTVPLAIAETTVTIAYDYSYVGIWATTTAAGVLAPGTDVALFRPDADTFRRWLYQFRLVKGSVSLHRIGWGNCLITGMGAP